MGVVRYDPTVVFAGYRLAVIAVADTGREPPEPAEIVEVGVTILDDGTISQTTTWLVHPQRTITAWAARGHGITNNEVATAPTIDTVADPIRDTIGDRIMVAHRGLHCHDLLAAALPGWSPSLVLDIRRLSALAWPTHSQALGSLTAQARLTVSGTPGRARHDAPATAMLFLAAAKRLNLPPERLFAPAIVLEGQSR